jgi:hypothetical protein
MASKGHTLASAQGFFVKCEPVRETKEELAAYVAQKMDIIDNFCVGRHKLKAKERKELEKAMLAIQTKWGIDKYFRTFIDNRI